MKTSPDFKTRFFAFFLAAQFLNVQIQTSFATEAIVASNPEIQQSMQRLEEHLNSRLSGKSEKQIQRFAYQLYRLNLKIRNKVVLKDASPVQLDSADQETMDTLQGGQQVVSQDSLKDAQKKVNREQILSKNDAFLISLGSKEKSDGTLSKVSFNEFKDHVSKLKAEEIRGPASAGRIFLKVIYCLLILAAAVALFYVFGLTLFFMVYGGILSIAVGNALSIVLIAGLITGCFFGIRAVIRSAYTPSLQNSSTVVA